MLRGYHKYLHNRFILICILLQNYFCRSHNYWSQMLVNSEDSAMDHSNKDWVRYDLFIPIISWVILPLLHSTLRAVTRFYNKWQVDLLAWVKHIRVLKIWSDKIYHEFFHVHLLCLKKIIKNCCYSYPYRNRLQ